MNIIVIFNSKTGFTKRYAEWIAEELACDTLPYKDFTSDAVSGKDVVIFGTRIHAGIVEHLNKIKTYFNNPAKQKFIVFATGGTPNEAESVINNIWVNNLSESERKTIPHFYMQSGLNYEKMGFIDKKLMKMAAWFMGKKKNKNDHEAGHAQAIQKSYDVAKKERIFPLVCYVKDKLTSV